MANKILTPNIIAREALMVLRSNCVMANLVHRDYSKEFVAGRGNTISVRKPATFVANEFNGKTITVQDATEEKVDVKMDKFLDVSFKVTSEDLTLNIEDFSKQFLTPAMQSFADKIDSYIIALEKDVTASRVSHADGLIAPADIIKARKFLIDNKAPSTERRLVIGSQADADLLSNELFVSAEKVGDAGTALREASLGRKFGFDIYTDQNVTNNGTYTPSIAFHKNAFCFVTRPLALPQGAAKSAVVDYDGFGLRVVYDYDVQTKSDTISIDMLCGFKTLDKRLAAVIEDTRSAE